MDRRPPLYLHFLDRELWESIGQEPRPTLIDLATRVLLLSTEVPLYCGLSLVWENPSVHGRNEAISEFLHKLVDIGVLDLISQYASAEEFLETRRELYRDDRTRYPAYFKKRRQAGPRATRIKKSSATTDLAVRMDSWARGNNQLAISSDNNSAPLRKAVGQALTDRDERAITFALFRPFIADARLSTASAEFQIRRQISRVYCSHYMDFAGGDIATGIRELSEFDDLSKNFPEYDIELLFLFLNYFGASAILDVPLASSGALWLTIAAKRSADLFSSLYINNLRLIIRCLHRLALQNPDVRPSNDGLFGVRLEIKRLLQKHLGTLRLPTIEFNERSFEKLAFASSQAISILESQKELKKLIATVKSEIGQLKPTVLLVTATQIERDTVLKLAANIVGCEAQIDFGKRRGFFRLGDMGGVTVFLVQCEMGSGTPGASLITVNEVIEDTQPVAVIMVGIAFGMDERKQRIGEIIVSRQLVHYELSRIGTGKKGEILIKARGDKVTASTKLLNQLRIAEAGWSGKKVRFGPLLTGEKLVDNIDYRNQLQKFETEAEGGEMEGAGLYTAATEKKVDWIIVKAICDWADGNKSRNKSRRQSEAAKQAVGFVLRAIVQGGFAHLDY